MRTWRALLAAAAVAAGGGCATPAPGSPPTVAQNEVVRRIVAYAARIEAEVPGLSGLTDESPDLSTPPCGGDAASWAVAPAVRYPLPASGAAAGPALRRWAAANGFRPDPTGGTSTAGDGSSAPGTTSGTTPGTGTLRAADGVALTVEPAVPGDPSGSLVLAGPCAWPASRTGGPTGTALPPTPTPRGPARVTDARAVCTGPSVLTTAAPYAGRGPHPVAVADVTTPGEPVWSSPTLPVGWTAGRPQLVACVRVEQTAFTGRTLRCEYDVPRPSEVEWQVHRATYRVTVLEAATGRRVGGFALPSRPGTDERDCPRTAEDRAGVQALAERLDTDRLETALRPLALLTR